MLNVSTRKIELKNIDILYGNETHLSEFEGFNIFTVYYDFQTIPTKHNIDTMY